MNLERPENTRFMLGQQLVEEFLWQFDGNEEYRVLACHASLPLALTPELLKFLRHEFLPHLSWVAEVDLLLSHLCAEAAEDVYVMQRDARAYLIKQMRQDPALGVARIEAVNRLLIDHLDFLARNHPALLPQEWETQRLSAMLFVTDKRDAAARKLSEAIYQCLSGTGAGSNATSAQVKAELARLTRMVREAADDLNAKEYEELVQLAQLTGKILADRNGKCAEELQTTGELAQSFQLPGISVKLSATQLVERIQLSTKSASKSAAGTGAAGSAFLIQPGTDPNDRWKGAFGGASERNHRRLTASVEPFQRQFDPLADWFTLILTVSSTDPEQHPLQGIVQFFLHPTFSEEEIAVATENQQQAIFRTNSWGAFTVGVLTDGVGTKLELDLAEQTHLPYEFRHPLKELVAQSVTNNPWLSKDKLPEFEEQVNNLIAARQSLSPNSIFDALMALGHAFANISKYHFAIVYYEHAKLAARRTNNRVNEETVLAVLGAAKQKLGDLAGARANYEQIVAIAREYGDGLTEAIALSNLAKLDEQTGRPKQAIENAEEALRLFEQLGASETAYIDQARELLARLRPITAPPEDLTGVVLSEGYRLIRRHWKGHLGTDVYVAESLSTPVQQVSVKVFDCANLSPVSGQWAERQYEEEIRVLSLPLVHPGMVALRGQGRLPDGLRYLILDEEPQPTLRARMELGIAMPLPTIAAIVLQIADALEYLHARRVVYRNLKPDNIALTEKQLEGGSSSLLLNVLKHLPDQPVIHQDIKPANVKLISPVDTVKLLNWQSGTTRIKLMDFGLAILLDEIGAELIRLENQTGAVGTPAYMASEQIAGEPTVSSDVYALGVLTYELVTGRLPFTASQNTQYYALQQLGVDRFPRELRPDLPEPTTAALLKCLSFRAQDRFPSARDFALQFAQSLQSQNTQHSPVINHSVFEFETVFLDQSGKVKERRNLTARQFVEDLGQGVGLEMVEIPGGKFLMGTSEKDKERVKKEYTRYWGKESAERWVNSEMPQREVSIESFYLGKFTVTQKQWRLVAGWEKVERDLDPNTAHFKERLDSDNRPVEQVSWEDAKEFCARLSQKTGRAYRLPSEAEWEYACRAGTTTPFAFGETITHDIVNFDSNRPYAKAKKLPSRGETIPVGTLGVANAFGVFDMHGNVWEWCEDVWHQNYEDAPMDGSAWLSGGDSSSRVMRGGSWYFVGIYCRSALRLYDLPGSRVSNYGFRVVVSARTSVPRPLNT